MDDSIRPAITPLAWFSLALWASCAISFATCGNTTAPRESFLILDALIVICIVLLAFFRIGSLPLVVALGVMCGVLVGLTHNNVMQSQSMKLSDEDRMYVAYALEDFKRGEFSNNVTVEIEKGELSGSRVRLSYEDDLEIQCHQRITFTAKTLELKEASTEKIRQAGCIASMKASVVAVEGVREPFAPIVEMRQRAIETLTKNGASPLTQALSCGWRAELLASPSYDRFKSTGLAHLVAVSGAHLVIVTTTLSALLGLLAIPKLAKSLVLTLFMVAYFAIAGCPISALRAMAMAGIGMFSFSAHRRPSSMNALAITTVLIVLFDPPSCLSTSFCLSALSTWGIIIFARLFTSWLPKASLPEIVSEPLSLTLSASLFTLPLSGALFSQLPVIAPLANVLVAPLFPVLCVLSLLAALTSIVLPFCFPVFLSLASFFAHVVDQLVTMLSTVPFSCIPLSTQTVEALIFTFVAFLMLWFLWPCGVKRALATVAVALVAGMCLMIILQPKGDRLVMLDVGQGDAFLFASEGSALLVDTGTQDAKLLSSLAKQHVLSLDYLLLTHVDDDHCGSLEALSQAVEIRSVALSKPVIDSKNEKCVELIQRAKNCSQSLVALRVGDHIEVGKFHVKVIHPEKLQDDGGNADSMCLIVGFDADDDEVFESRIAMTGDAEADTLETLMRQGLLNEVDVLKVSHHGSKNGLTKLF